MVLIAGLREDIGYDFNAYKTLYNYIRNVPFLQIENIEMGYIFLNKFSCSFEVLILIMAILGVGIKIFYINKYSKNKLISMLIYFSGIYIMFDMGVIRQGVSISIALISIEYIYNRKFLKFILTILCGSLFHSSIWIFMPVYFLYYKSLSRKLIYGITSVSLIFYFFNLDEHFIKLISSMNIPIISNKISYYYSLDIDNNLFVSILKRIVFLIIFTEVYKKRNIVDKKDMIFFNCYFLSVIFMCLFPSIPILSGRGNMSLFFMQVFIFATLFSNLKEYILSKIVLFLIIVIMSVNTMNSILYDNDNTSSYIPYKSLIDKYL